MKKENLRPEDLMVGDWVLLFDKTPVKVDCIGNVEVYLTEPRGQHELDWRVTYEHIKPIPLTPEILEKNGFVMEERDGVAVRYSFATNLYNPTQAAIQFAFYDGGVFADKLFKCRASPKDCYGINELHICDLKFVHELQHALRLCGIDKKIVL